MSPDVQINMAREKRDSPLATYTAVIGLLIGLFASFIAWSNKQAVNELRLSTLEEKTRQYDALIIQRNIQYTATESRLSRIEARLDALVELLKEREQKR